MPPNKTPPLTREQINEKAREIQRNWTFAFSTRATAGNDYTSQIVEGLEKLSKDVGDLARCVADLTEEGPALG